MEGAWRARGGRVEGAWRVRGGCVEGAWRARKGVVVEGGGEVDSTWRTLTPTLTRTLTLTLTLTLTVRSLLRLNTSSEVAKILQRMPNPCLLLA